MAGLDTSKQTCNAPKNDPIIPTMCAIESILPPGNNTFYINTLKSDMERLMGISGGDEVCGQILDLVSVCSGKNCVIGNNAMMNMCAVMDPVGEESPHDTWPT